MPGHRLTQQDGVNHALRFRLIDNALEYLLILPVPKGGDGKCRNYLHHLGVNAPLKNTANHGALNVLVTPDAHADTAPFRLR